MSRRRQPGQQPLLWCPPAASLPPGWSVGPCISPRFLLSHCRVVVQGAVGSQPQDRTWSRRENLSSVLPMFSWMKIEFVIPIVKVET